MCRSMNLTFSVNILNYPIELKFKCLRSMENMAVTPSHLPLQFPSVLFALVDVSRFSLVRVLLILNILIISLHILFEYTDHAGHRKFKNSEVGRIETDENRDAATAHCYVLPSTKSFRNIRTRASQTLDSWTRCFNYWRNEIAYLRENWPFRGQARGCVKGKLRRNGFK